MQASEIKAAVQAFRADEMKKIHACVNSAPYWRQDEALNKELRALDVRETRYAASLGQPDDQPVEPPAGITGSISISLDSATAVAGAGAPTPVVPGAKQ